MQQQQPTERFHHADWLANTFDHIFVDKRLNEKSRPYRLIAVGAALGIGGLALKGLFVWLGVGPETHDMTTHEITPENPLLLNIHHLFQHQVSVLHYSNDQCRN